jgi:hypothetical protein
MVMEASRLTLAAEATDTVQSRPVRAPRAGAGVVVSLGGSWPGYKLIDLTTTTEDGNIGQCVPGESCFDACYTPQRVNLTH